MRATHVLAAGLLAVTAGGLQAQAQGFSDNAINLGVLTDMSGVYSDFSGRGSLAAVQMAVEDFAGIAEQIFP